MKPTRLPGHRRLVGIGAAIARACSMPATVSSTSITACPPMRRKDWRQNRPLTDEAQTLASPGK